MIEKDLLTVSEAANLKVYGSRRAISARITAGTLPATKYGHQYLIKLEDLKNWQDRRVKRV